MSGLVYDNNTLNYLFRLPRYFTRSWIIRCEPHLIAGKLMLWSQDLRVDQVKKSCIRVEHKRTQ